MTIAFIGAGSMAYALAGGIRKQHPEALITASDPSPERLQLFEKEFPPFRAAESNRQAAADAEVLILAVKPQILPQVLPDLADFPGLAISIAAGIPLKTLTAGLPRAAVARVMPNTPCLVGEMAAGVAFSEGTAMDQKAQVISLLSASGVVREVPEEQMNAVTGLSGSGPAFMARLFDYFIQGAAAEGLPEETARDLCLQTALGTARLLQEKEMSPEELISMVSSPGGTTLAGREVLEASDTGEVIRRTIGAARRRGKELGS